MDGDNSDEDDDELTVRGIESDPLYLGLNNFFEGICVDIDNNATARGSQSMCLLSEHLVIATTRLPQNPKTPDARC